MKSQSIKAIPYLRAVAQFARAEGLRFFTWRDWKIAIEAYKLTAKSLS